MRTTLTLDDDVVAHLRRIQAESGGSWKSVVNDVIRAGVVAREEERRTTEPRPHPTRPVRLGRPIPGDISNVHQALSLAEGDVPG
ncbi:MAG: hypothetical protein JXA83_16320 [Acidimicrobiales bacterium]|nr:hypothetical protein [Acidimicrobiales bacterium]